MNRIHKRILCLLLALTMLCGMMPMAVSAAEFTEVQNPFMGKTVSILSHSASTYAGVSNNTLDNSTIGNNDVYYTEGRHGVYLKDTWWQQVIDALGMKLLVNNSWSGSCVFEPRKGESSVGYGDRALNLHNDHTGEEPDIILVYLGGNDYAYFKDTFGKAADVDYSAIIQNNGNGIYTYATPKTACEAYAIMLHKVETRYPNAEIYCMTQLAARENDYVPDGRPHAGQPTEYMAELMKIAADFQLPVIDIENTIPKEDALFDQYMGDKRAHPNAEGMDLISQTVISEMLGRKVPLYDVSGVYTGVKTSNSAAVAIEGWAYRTELTVDNGADMDVTVTMGGVDVTEFVYNNGVIHIETVTGDIEITAKSNRELKEFRWEVVNGHLTSTGKNENTLIALSESITDGVVIEGKYQFAVPVILKHDCHWTMEWKCAGDWRGILLATDLDANVTGRFGIARTKGGQLIIGIWDGKQNNNYGVDLSGLDAQTHTYRLENRIAVDGSNMVWLYLDGAEIGPMNNYFIGSKDQNTTADWVSGKDFVFPYIGMDKTPLTNCQLDYLTIRETGHTHTYKNGLCTACGEKDPDGLSLDGLNVLCLGDSITAGQGLTTATRWTNVLASKYGWNLTNKSQGGISLTSYYYTANGQTDISIAKKAEILKTMAKKPDVIIVWGGHNDTNYRASPLGTWDDETTDSFKGALKHIAKLADEYAPNATLFVLTPLWVNEKPSTLKVPANTTDTNWMFVDAIYEGAEKYGWIPINMDLCGITPFTKSGLLLDNIHPNEAGTEKIVAYLSEELASCGENSRKKTVVFDQSAVSLKVGESMTVKGVPSPRSGMGTAVLAWTSSDPSIATVDSDGDITAVAPGRTMITATASGGTSADIEVIVLCEHSYQNGICTACGAPALLMGDLNNDGLIDTADVVSLRRHIAGGYDIKINPTAADVNGDAVLDTTDVVWLRRYIAGGYGIVLSPPRA